MQKNRNKQINLNYLVYAKGKKKNFQRKKKGDRSTWHLKASPLYICRYVRFVYTMYGDMWTKALSGFRGFVLPVVDLRVEVTVEDVIEGKQSSSWE